MSENNELENIMTDYRDVFTEYIKETFMNKKIEDFFELVINNYPDSKPCLLDIKECINSNMVNLIYLVIYII